MKATQLSRTFHPRHWPIGAKLASSFGLIILVTIGLAATSLFSLLSIQRTLDKALSEGLRIETLGHRIQDRLSDARRQEQAFLLRWQDEGYQNATRLYLMPRGSYIADIRRTTAALDNLTANQQTEFSIDVNAKSHQLMAALETCDTEFNLVTDLLMSRGTNQSGAIGNLETVSLELAELETLGQPELINIFLRLRLNEKQYRLLKEQQYSGQMSLALQELRATLAHVAPAESERLVPLLDRYEQAFDEVNRLDAEIASHSDHYTAAAESIQSLASDIAADVAELADEELDSVTESVQQAYITLVSAIVVAAALGMVLSVVLTRQISRPIRVLTDTAMEIKRGNLAAQVHVESGDEVGLLAAVFNSMTAQLRQTLEDLEQRVADRTAELSEVNVNLQCEITEHRQAEETLHKSQTLFHSLIESLPQNIFSKDLKGRFTFANQRYCMTEGKSLADIIGKTDFDLHPPELAKKYQEDDRRIIEAGQIFEMVEEHQPMGGKKFYVQVIKTPIYDSDGQVTGLLGIFWDITERKRAEEQLQQYAAKLEQANEELKGFAYVASHNLRAPLVNLKGFTAELRAALAVLGSAVITALPTLDEKQQQTVTMALEEDVPEALGFIDSAVTRMDRLTDALLELSHLNRRELRLEPMDMNALVQATLETLAHQIEERQVRVTVGPLPEVVADRTSMEQIMGNLLNNAVIYLDPARPGEIEISGERDHDETIFRVRDNGRGIAGEDMDKVFAPFRRAGRQDVPGEGMGLAYVQTLVRRHGGRIWCESELGMGTTFTFTLSMPKTQRGRRENVSEEQEGKVRCPR